MIQINLLDDLEDVDLGEGKKLFARPSVLIGTSLVLAVSMIGGYKYYRMVVKKGLVQRSTEVPVPKRPEYKPQVVLSHVVEELVREIEEEQRLAPREPTYQSLTPGAQVEYQLYIARKALQFFKDRTTPRIGFTDLVISTPGDIYLRGRSMTLGDYQTFFEELQKGTELSIREGEPVQKYGEKGVKREFSLYGKFRFKEPPASTNRLVAEAELGDELRAFREKASAVGINFSTPELQSNTNMGPFKQRLYTVHATGLDFGAFYQLINSLYLGQSHVGIAKFALRASGDETIDIELNLLIYSP